MLQLNQEPYKTILNKVNEIFAKHLQPLVGIYLHGSLAMNCHNFFKSDIDLLVVMDNEAEFLSPEAFRPMISALIKLEDEYSVSFEMSALTTNQLNACSRDTEFVVHYSKTHREKYIENQDYFCGGFGDPDLVAHFHMIQNHGQCLSGPAIKDVFKGDYFKGFTESILMDCRVESAEAELNPTYYILNDCRTAMFLKTGKTGSKLDGGQWALKNLTDLDNKTIEMALLNYLGSESYLIEVEAFKTFRTYMIEYCQGL